MSAYKSKYDIGPTQTGLVFSLPVYDAKIDFEDLVVFSISYGQSVRHELPKVMPQTAPVSVSLGRPVDTGSEVRLPVLIGGEVSDIRAMSLELDGAFGSFLGAEKGEMLRSYTTPVTVFGRSEGRSVFVDCAVMGLEAPGLNGVGEVLVLRFAGATSVGLTKADCRTSGNARLDVALTREKSGSMPMAYALEQNFPNPFNPVTTITFAIPVRAGAAGTLSSAMADWQATSLQVFDLLGRHVATLVEGMCEAGMHSVRFDASNLSSGVYIYRLRAGEFTSVKSMLLVK
jgi:hypothetical protein